MYDATVHLLPMHCQENKTVLPPHLPVPQDLYDAIARGEYPEWRLFIQTMDPAVGAGVACVLSWRCWGGGLLSWQC